MEKHLRVSLAVAIALSVDCLFVSGAGMARAAGEAATPPGPCCRTGHAAKAPGRPASYWSKKNGKFAGPRHLCQTPAPVVLSFAGKTNKVQAVEAADTLLVPAQVLALVGATVESLGRAYTFTRGTKKLEVTVGSSAVKLTDGENASAAEWDLCPRLYEDTAYVPLRAAATALGLSVSWDKEAVTLAEADSTAAEVATPPECPASRIESELGVTVLRSSAAGPSGPGIGILAVADGGRGADLGLRPRDVILSCNKTRTSCPKDLDAIIQDTKAQNLCVCSVTVARGRSKVTLQGKPQPAAQ